MKLRPFESRETRRRLCVALGGGLALVGGGARAALPPAPAETVQPYSTVDSPVAEDARTVRLFFSYGCNHCRANHRAIAAWGSTLPKAFEFREAPVVVASAEAVTAGFAFYAMRALAPTRLPEFNDAVYAAAQERGRSLADVRTFAEAARAVGVTEARFRDAWKSPATGRLVSGAADLMRRYRLQATPTIAVAGRMLVTPEITGGVNDAFYRLANAVVSKAMIDGGLT